ncbi:MAG: DinB family protein [Planctomycetota bacterium]
MRDSFLPELDQELASTRRILESVPEAKTGFRPHAKSWTLGELSLHVAHVLTWLPTTLQTDEFDLSPPGGAPWVPPTFDSAAATLAKFEEHAREARAALAEASDATLSGNWTLKRQGQKLFTMPRAGCLRSFVMNHLIHHRGQLTVYLRLCDVALPPIYGPTADFTGDRLAAQAHGS